MSEINPLLVTVPIVGAFLVLAIFAYRRLQADKQAEAALAAAKEASPPADTVEISISQSHYARADRSGRIMLVLAGTFGESLGDNLLNLLDRCGLQQAIGSVLLAEMDARRRDLFLANAPEAFNDRIVPVSFRGLSGGLGNRSPEEVLEFVDLWGPPMIRGAEAVIDRHQYVNNGQEPALVLLFVSQGGQAVIGTKALDFITRQFRMAQVYGFTALPVDDLLRQQVDSVLDSYRDLGAKGFVIADNLNDEVRNDFGMIGAIAGFIAASESSDSAVEINNALRLMFEEAPGGLVSYSTYVRGLPGYRFQPHPKLVPTYYVYKDSVVSSILTGLKEVVRPEYHALGLNGDRSQVPLTSTFDVVLAGVVPQDLKEDEDDVVLARQLSGVKRRNNHLVFAPITAQIDPDEPRCPIGVVSLHALPDGVNRLQSLLAPRLDSSSTSPLPTGNGADPEPGASEEVSHARS